jgi:hypothetical protein
MDGAKKMERSIGYYKIAGERTGEKMVDSE